MGRMGLQSFVLLLKLTVSLDFWPRKKKKKTTKPQIKKEHWRWEEATGTEAKQTMAGKGESKLQRGSLAEDAQRAD